MRYALTAEQARRVLASGCSGLIDHPTWRRTAFERAVAPLWPLLSARCEPRPEQLPRAIEEAATHVPLADQEAFLDAIDVLVEEEVGPIEPDCRCGYCERARARTAEPGLVPGATRVRSAFADALRTHLRLVVPSCATTPAWAGQPRLEWDRPWDAVRSRPVERSPWTIAQWLGFPPPPPLPRRDPFERSCTPTWVYDAVYEVRADALGDAGWGRSSARRRPPPRPEELAERARRAEAAEHWLAARDALRTVHREHARTIWSLVTRGLERFGSPVPRCYWRHVEQRIAPVVAHLACTAIPVADQAAALEAARMLPAGVRLGAVPGCRCGRCRAAREGPDPTAGFAPAIVPWFVDRLAGRLEARFRTNYHEEYALGMPMRVRGLYWQRRQRGGGAA